MVLMHKENFTQVEVPTEMLSETEHRFLEEGLALRVQSYEGQPLIVRLPKHMTVRACCARVQC
jgi:translation elongation factor P/translation initiation factor 5A